MPEAGSFEGPEKCDLDGAARTTSSSAAASSSCSTLPSPQSGGLSWVDCLVWCFRLLDAGWALLLGENLCDTSCRCLAGSHPTLQALPPFARY